jgi:hypothetical protein
MAHTGGSGGFVRPMNFTEGEVCILWENAILVPPVWHLPHGWHVGFTMHARDVFSALLLRPLAPGARIKMVWKFFDFFYRKT